MTQPAAPTAPKRNIPLLVLSYLFSIGSGLGIVFLMTQVLDRNSPWEDVVSLALGLWLISVIPIGELRRAALPGIGFEGFRLVSAATFIVSGLVIIAPVLAPPSIDRTWLYAIAAIATLGSIAVGLLAEHRQADEMLRAVGRETAVIALLLSQTGLFFYAFANRLGLVGEITPWGIYLLGTAIYYVAGFIVIFRRGLDRQPRD